MTPSDRHTLAGAHPLRDPLVIALLAFAALLTWGQVQMRRPSAVAAEAGADARLFELRWALGGHLEPKPSKGPRTNPWDNAVEAVICFEGGRAGEATDRLAHAPDGAFRVCWGAAYGQGPAPTVAETKEAMRGLGPGLAASLLDAALIKKGGGDSEGAREGAIDHYRRKAYALFSALALALAGALAGVAVGVRMIARRADLPDLPDLAASTLAFQMTDAVAVRIFLAWYIVFLSSATVAAWIGAVVPLGPFAMPVAYLLHSVCGLGLVCRAEGITFAALWGRMAPKTRQWLRGGLKFLSLTLACALVLNLAMSPFLPDGDPPQKDLMDFIRSVDGIVPFAAAFGTVALLGPFFEEMFFRGFLLPIARRRASPTIAILVSGALFGAVHLQPLAFPLLTVLGSVMGLAFLSTRDIRSAVLVHACWNGGAFLLQRLLMGG
jgi:membrane protease YdiL (CAAX protease family)